MHSFPPNEGEHASCCMQLEDVPVSICTNIYMIKLSKKLDTHKKKWDIYIYIGWKRDELEYKN